LALTKWQIQNCRNSGRITTAEIMQAQAKLRSPPQPADSIAPTNPLTYENAPPEVFDAIRSQLGGRANAMLARNAVDNLSAFMKLTNERLLKLRWCGTTNANLILALQTRLAEYAQARAREPSEFRLEMLLWAPCLGGKSTEEKGLAPAEGVHVDPENPAPWLLNWIRELAQADKYARVFMLRMGMLGSAPATLESIGQPFGVSRERVRQMTAKVTRKAATRYQQFRLRPLVEATARVVDEKGGMVGLEEVTQAVLGRGRDGAQLKFATGLMAFLVELQVWKDAGVWLRNDRMVCNLSRVGTGI
jgi:hypothetical protein